MVHCSDEGSNASWMSLCVKVSACTAAALGQAARFTPLPTTIPDVLLRRRCATFLTHARTPPLHRTNAAPEFRRWAGGGGGRRTRSREEGMAPWPWRSACKVVVDSKLGPANSADAEDPAGVCVGVVRVRWRGVAKRPGDNNYFFTIFYLTR